jgi:hypothetical protein
MGLCQSGNRSSAFKFLVTSRIRDFFMKSNIYRNVIGFNQANSLSILPFLLILLLGLKSCTSQAKGKFSRPLCAPSAGLVKEELDYGINISTEVTNVGQPGYITITPELSTSEGEWTRNQELYFKANESKNLTYFFSEPTINSANVQCRVEVSPGMND